MWRHCYLKGSGGEIRSYRLNKKDGKSAMFFIKHGKAVHSMDFLLPKILFGEFILSKATRAVNL